MITKKIFLTGTYSLLLNILLCSYRSDMSMATPTIIIEYSVRRQQEDQNVIILLENYVDYMVHGK